MKEFVGSFWWNLAWNMVLFYAGMWWGMRKQRKKEKSGG